LRFLVPAVGRLAADALLHVRLAHWRQPVRLSSFLLRFFDSSFLRFFDVKP